MSFRRTARHGDHGAQALASALCGPEGLEQYNLGLHIAAIFIVMAIVLAQRSMKASKEKSTIVDRVKDLVIEMGKAFGTGVVISTGFIHMLMEAAEKFENECAPWIFHQYEAWAFAICIFTIFCIQALEFFMTRSFVVSAQEPLTQSIHEVDEEAADQVVLPVTGKGHQHDSYDDGLATDSTAALETCSPESSDESLPVFKRDSLAMEYGTYRPKQRATSPCVPADCTPACVDHVAVMIMPRSAEPGPIGEDHCATLIAESDACVNQNLGTDEIQRIKYVHVDPAILGINKFGEEADGKSVPAASYSHGHGHGHMHGHIHIHHHDTATASRLQKLRKRVAVMVLEAGIAVHSVIIGITLGVQPDGGDFTALIIALSFHQFFEGWALAEATRDAQYHTIRPIIATGIFYALTTPVGVAIGVGIHGTYNANSSTAITLLGVLDSICAGILIYMGLVQFMSAWFTNNVEFMRKPLWHILSVYSALLAGLTAMACIGIWL